MTIDEAIKISKILSGAPEERLPMILSVLAKADVCISGLDELEEWKLFKDMAEILDMDEFVKDLAEAFPECSWDFQGSGKQGGLRIPAQSFSDFCKRKKLRPTPTKRALARKGYLRTSTEKDKTNYTETAWIDGRGVRCVFIRREAKKE